MSKINNTIKESFLMHNDISSLSFILFFFLIIISIALISKRKSISSISLLNKKRIIVFFGIALLSLRVISDISIFMNLAKLENAEDFISSGFNINRLIIYIASLWMISSKLNKFILISPIVIFSSIWNYLQTSQNWHEMLTSLMIIVAIQFILIMVNVKFTFKKVVASFFLTASIIAFSFIVVSPKTTEDFAESLVKISLWSLQLMIFSGAFIMIYRFVSLGKSKNHARELINEIKKLIQERNKIIVISREYKEYIFADYFVQKENFDVNDEIIANIGEKDAIDIDINVLVQEWNIVNKISVTKKMKTLIKIFGTRAPSLLSI